MVAPGATNTSLEPIASHDLVNPNVYDANAPHHSASDMGCDSCGAVDQCGCNPVGFLLDWSRAELWLGMTSFTGEGSFLTTGTGNQGQVGGSFGVQEGFNFGSRMPSVWGGQVGVQLGMRFTHTQFDGTVAGDDNRTQAFATVGMFRRVDYGLQGGLVVDYLNDDWVYQADLVQLRGELSFLFSPCHEFGFRFTDSQQTSDVTAIVNGSPGGINVRLAALNTYRFFYRYRFGNNGRGLAELKAGFTEQSSGILGIDLKTPLQNQLGLQASATYLFPPNDATDAFTREGWNMGIAVVWTPGRWFGTQRDYYRPLLDVADNGSLATRRTGP